ncbi:MAG: sensor histidine kinase N-terminal domain-containing protein [Betaproteobacteria bacterium]|nr:sensor histidine kinase N-terminal domain-containing protein [Betaproteobacteria bacterium]
MVERLVASSLRNRLLALVLGGVAVAWIGAAVFAYRDARHEADELLDGYLAQSAALIVTQAGGDLDDLEVEHAPQLHRYARRVAFQIWDDGKTLRTHSVNAPDRRLSPRTEGFDEVEVNGQTWRVFSSYDPQRKILVQVGEVRSARDAIAGAVAQGLAAPLIVALPVLGVLLWIAVTLGLAPLQAMGRAVARRDPANLAPLDVGSPPREVAPLVASLNSLFERVRASMEHERRFTADAAHELRTPVAALRAQAEVALAAADETQRRHALEGVIAGCDRVAHLIGQLLTLARLDPAGTISPLGTADLAVVAREVAATHAQAALDRGLELSVEAPVAAIVAVEPALLQILLRNLVDNAVRYAAGQGHEIRIEVTAGDCPVCRVVDDGPGIPPEERARLGERFHRREGTGEQGSGLGLSIVRRIADLCAATVAFETAPAGHGLCVTVHFPRPR